MQSSVAVGEAGTVVVHEAEQVRACCSQAFVELFHRYPSLALHLQVETVRLAVVTLILHEEAANDGAVRVMYGKISEAYRSSVAAVVPVGQASTNAFPEKIYPAASPGTARAPHVPSAIV